MPLELYNPTSVGCSINSYPRGCGDADRPCTRGADAEKYELALTGKNVSLEASIDAQNLAVHLQKLIDELPDRRKEAFILSRHHDLSHKEISNIMGLSERTVNTHIFLALKHLRTRLDALQNDSIRL